MMMMQLYLTQGTTEPAPATISNPIYILVGAVIAGVAALIVALITNWRADSREVEKTRREVLSNAVTGLIEKSETRYTMLADDALFNGGHEIDNELENKLLELERAMKFDVYRIQIHGSDRLYRIAYELYKFHSDSGAEILKVNMGEQKYMESGIDYNEVALTTTALIKEIRIETKLTKKRKS